MKCRKKCELFQACSESSAGELLTTIPSIYPSKGPPKQVCGEKGRWQQGLWGPPTRSSAWKDVDWLQCMALPQTSHGKGLPWLPEDWGALCLASLFPPCALFLCLGPHAFTPSCRCVACPASIHLTAPPWASSCKSPPASPHGNSSSSPALFPPLLTAVVSQPCAVTWPQLSTTDLPKAGLAPWQSPTSSPGRLGQTEPSPLREGRATV